MLTHDEHRLHRLSSDSDQTSGGEQLDAEEAVSSGGEQLDAEEAVNPGGQLDAEKAVSPGGQLDAEKTVSPGGQLDAEKAVSPGGQPGAEEAVSPGGQRPGVAATTTATEIESDCTAVPAASADPSTRPPRVGEVSRSKRRLTWHLQKRNGHRSPLEQYTKLPRPMTIRDIAADFRVDPDLYCEFLRTYDAFAPGGRLVG